MPDAITYRKISITMKTARTIRYAYALVFIYVTRYIARILGQLKRLKGFLENFNVSVDYKEVDHGFDVTMIITCRYETPKCEILNDHMYEAMLRYAMSYAYGAHEAVAHVLFINFSFNVIKSRYSTMLKARMNFDFSRLLVAITEDPRRVYEIIRKAYRNEVQKANIVMYIRSLANVYSLEPILERHEEIRDLFSVKPVFLDGEKGGSGETGGAGEEKS